MSPNLLKFFGLNRFEFPPPYLEYIHTTQDKISGIDVLTHWINNNCKSRYYLGVTIGVNTNNKIDKLIKIGFENPKELSYFILACPHLK